MAEKRDYYDVLGVDRNATASEIKHAFRMMAVKLHPDQNQDVNAVASFGELREAFGVLSDDRSRSFYDRNGVAEFDATRARTEEALDDLFEPGSRRARAATRPDARRGDDVCVRLPLSLDDVRSNDSRSIVYARLIVCTECAGVGGGKSQRNCESCGGSGRLEVRKGFDCVTLPCEACGRIGRRPRERCRSCDGLGRIVRRTRIPLVPADDPSRRLVRIEAAGDEVLGGAPGDLLILFASSRESNGRES